MQGTALLRSRRALQALVLLIGHFAAVVVAGGRPCALAHGGDVVAIESTLPVADGGTDAASAPVPHDHGAETGVVSCGGAIFTGAGTHASAPEIVADARAIPLDLRPPPSLSPPPPFHPPRA